eukprot:3417614-Rhodomonas_salina.1
MAYYRRSSIAYITAGHGVAALACPMSVPDIANRSRRTIGGLTLDLLPVLTIPRDYTYRAMSVLDMAYRVLCQFQTVCRVSYVDAGH